MVTIEPKAGSHRPRWRLRTIAVLTAIAGHAYPAHPEPTSTRESSK